MSNDLSGTTMVRLRHRRFSEIFGFTPSCFFWSPWLFTSQQNEARELQGGVNETLRTLSLRMHEAFERKKELVLLPEADFRRLAAQRVAEQAKRAYWSANLCARQYSFDAPRKYRTSFVLDHPWVSEPTIDELRLSRFWRIMFRVSRQNLA